MELAHTPYLRLLLRKKEGNDEERWDGEELKWKPDDKSFALP